MGDKNTVFKTDDEVDQQVCSATWPKASLIPTQYEYEDMDTNTKHMEKVVGVTLNGVLMYTGNSEDGFDAYFP